MKMISQRPKINTLLKYRSEKLAFKLLPPIIDICNTLKLHKGQNQKTRNISHSYTRKRWNCYYVLAVLALGLEEDPEPSSSLSFG